MFSKNILTARAVTLAILFYALPLQANIFSVAGTVSYSNNNPAAGLIVKAYQKDLRQMQELGVASTSSAGHYQIRYQASPGITLIVRVYNKGEECGASAPIINVNENKIVNITLSCSSAKRKLQIHDTLQTTPHR